MRSPVDYLVIDKEAELPLRKKSINFTILCQLSYCARTSSFEELSVVPLKNSV